MQKGKPKSAYLISGVWRDYGQVTHYAVHELYDPGVSGIRKFSKEKTIELVISSGLPFYTWEWNYDKGHFEMGEAIHAVHDHYLWTTSKNEMHKSLGHLISYSWLPDE
ncbi:hypothetical protein [Flavobacterium sp.]|uniref:hypothetical protein n=1 Tax=Flavobacterium sp. TaxID=239 RepID=UPI00260D3169|nr:hypothetical protein [Flavobacterium sp.]